MKTIRMLLLLGLAAIAFMLGMLYYYSERPGPSQQDVYVLIPPGSTVGTAANALLAQQAITHPQLFKAVWRLRSTGRSIQAGEYLIPAGATPYMILKKMVEGDVFLRRITIPEGFATRQLLGRLMNDSVLQGELPQDVTEGTYLPDTYYYTYGDTRSEVLARMHAAQQTLKETLTAQYTNPPLSWEKTVILASIVERETPKAEERPLVASVFLNRLQVGMPLQSDPTVIYALTEGTMEMVRPLTRADLKIASPVNTYVNPGLPPTPICNPG
ncbi:MAG: endolytic transglycosylase MltG, partial [Rickettsiales bacterium]|nr:endolytic transglycosylase MltG [Rickettsiales bacterium]